MSIIDAEGIEQDVPHPPHRLGELVPREQHLYRTLDSRSRLHGKELPPPPCLHKVLEGHIAVRWTVTVYVLNGPSQVGSTRGRESGRVHQMCSEFGCFFD